jgi:hypothetical protein
MAKPDENGATGSELPAADPSDPEAAQPPYAVSTPPTCSVLQPAIAASVSSNLDVPTAVAFELSNWMVPIMTTSTFKGYDALIAFSQSNIDALIQANLAFTRAFEEIGKEIGALAQAELERVAVASREALAAKSVEEVLTMQTAFATASLKRLLATSTRLGELNVKLAKGTMVPITTKVSAALDKVTTRAA